MYGWVCDKRNSITPIKKLKKKRNSNFKDRRSLQGINTRSISGPFQNTVPCAIKYLLEQSVEKPSSVKTLGVRLSKVCVHIAPYVILVYNLSSVPLP